MPRRKKNTIKTPIEIMIGVGIILNLLIVGISMWIQFGGDSQGCKIARERFIVARPGTANEHGAARQDQGPIRADGSSGQSG